MECPYCGAELVYDDYYGTGRPEYYYGTAANGLHYPSTYKKLGDIYYCPNREGFEDLDEAKRYKENNIDDCCGLSLEDVDCGSFVFNGNFYTDQNDNLKEGYSC